MTGEADQRNPMLTALEGLATLEAAESVEGVLRAAVEAGCAGTASRRGLAGLSDGEAVTAAEWYDVALGWTGAPLRWDLGEGAPGRVCLSGTPLACNDLPGAIDCLPETTGALGLKRFACVPIPGDTECLGFLEVGDRAGDYTAGEIRCLRVIAGRAAHRLHTLAHRAEAEAEQRLCSEALLGDRGLFQLDPNGVLVETVARARELSGGDIAVVRLEGGGRPGTADLSDEARVALEEAAATRAPAVNGTRVAAVPLFAGDRLLAALVVRDSPERLAGERLEALAALAARAGVALEHATLYQTQAAIAHRLQERLLPLDPPVVPGLDIAVAYRSASHGAGRGGDFIDFYSKTGTHLALVIGDVAGKGVDALATTLLVKYALRTAVNGGSLSWPARPGPALQELHNALLGELGGESFVTALFALVGVRRRTLQLATAGHPAPFVVRAGGVERPLLLTAPALGIDLDAALTPYPTEVLALARGDCVVFFTDGIAELRDAHGRFFEDAMPAVLATAHDTPAAEVTARLLESAERFATRAPEDDIAVVCLRLTHAGDVKAGRGPADTDVRDSDDDGGTGDT